MAHPKKDIKNLKKPEPKTDYAAIDEVLKQSFDAWTQLSRGVLRVAKASSDPDSILGRALMKFDPTYTIGPPSREPLMPKDIYNAAQKKVEDYSEMFLQRLHSLNPPEERVGAVLREWLDIRFPGKTGETEDNAERIVVLALIIQRGSQLGLIPYRQLPEDYKLKTLAIHENDTRWSTLVPLMAMVRRAVRLERNNRAAITVMLSVLKLVKSEEEQAMIIGAFASALELSLLPPPESLAIPAIFVQPADKKGPEGEHVEGGPRLNEPDDQKKPPPGQYL